MSAESDPAAARSWPDYRAVWRWHFYASLFCMPFVVVLSISGAAYLFKTEIEAALDQPYDSLVVTSEAKRPSEQIRAAVSAVPGATFGSYELSQEADDAGRVIVRDHGKAIRVYVHPVSLDVLHQIPEDDRPMRFLFRLHGELLMGDRGSNLVELAASWTILMLVTGLYLWWPRNARGLGGVLYPRLWGGSRMFWRDLHSVTGVWISVFALFLLVTGLPWAKFWGEYFKTVRRLTNTAVAQQDWATGNDRGTGSRGGGSGGEHGGHGGSGRRRRGDMPTPADLTPVDRIAATLGPLRLPPPVVIAPPGPGESHWTAKSLTPNRPQRVNLVLDQAGTIVSREDFTARHPIDQAVGYGIAAHEGRLFGWPNQLLGLLTAAGLVLLCVSGVVLWWRRRDAGVLGAPKALLSPRVSAGLVTLVVLFGLYLPLFGASLILVLVLERMVLRRIPAVRHWLGLQQDVPTSALVHKSV